MKSKTFSLGTTPRITFRACVGDLRVHSWDQPEVQVLVGREEDLTAIHETDGGIELSSLMPATVHAPAGASVVLEGCAGDVHAVGLASIVVSKHRGDVSLHQTRRAELNGLHGDVNVTEAEALSVSVMHGDLRGRSVANGVAVRDVHGDVSLRHVAGESQLSGITGDIAISDLEGSLQATSVTGDLRLTGVLRTGTSALDILGDIHLSLDPGSDVLLDLEARLGRVRSSASLLDSTQSAHRLKGRLGNGAARLFVTSSSGDIRLSDTTDASREEQQAEGLEPDGLTVHIGHDLDERLARVRRWRTHWAPSPRPEPAESLEDERLAILKMLAEGKINAAQAAELLQSMEAQD
jgi:hypothetical protein